MDETYETLDEVPWNTVTSVASRQDGHRVGIVDGFAVWLTGPSKGQRIPLDAGGCWTAMEAS